MSAARKQHDADHGDRRVDHDHGLGPWLLAHVVGGEVESAERRDHQQEQGEARVGRHRLALAEDHQRGQHQARRAEHRVEDGERPQRQMAAQHEGS